MGDSVLLYAAYTGSGQSGKYNYTMPYFYNVQWNILYYVYLGILLQQFSKNGQLLFLLFCLR